MRTPFHSANYRADLLSRCLKPRISACAFAIICAGFSLSELTLLGQGAKGEERPAGVRTAVATTREVNRSQSFIGTLQPIRRATIGSAVEDRVARMLVDEGDFVTCPDDDSSSEEVAQPLIEIDRTTIDLEFESARIALELRKKALEELELSIPVELELAEARVRQTEAQRQYTQSAYERLKDLGKTASARTGRESFPVSNAIGSAGLGQRRVEQAEPDP